MNYLMSSSCFSLQNDRVALNPVGQLPRRECTTSYVWAAHNNFCGRTKNASWPSSGCTAIDNKLKPNKITATKLSLYYHQILWEYWNYCLIHCFGRIVQISSHKPSCGDILHVTRVCLCSPVGRKRVVYSYLYQDSFPKNKLF